MGFELGSSEEKAKRLTTGHTIYSLVIARLEREL